MSEKVSQSCKLWMSVFAPPTDNLYSGKSGSGKSSVASLLLRYYDPVRGRVTFDGQGGSATGDPSVLLTSPI
jgi:ABC-type transport system involved in cytochrome bd biosynthesis fused ATPase/permease subunit